MNVEFHKLKNTLDISRLSHLHIITIDDYGKAVHDKIDFPPGAHEIEVIYAKRNLFDSVSDLLIHIRSIPYADFKTFNPPNDFFDQVCFLTEMTLDQFMLHVDANFEGFFNHLDPILPGLNLWKVQMNFDDYEKGYKVEGTGTSQVLICQTSAYYMYFVSRSIDEEQLEHIWKFWKV